MSNTNPSNGECAGSKAGVQAAPGEPINPEPDYVQAEFWDEVGEKDGRLNRLYECRRCGLEFWTEASPDGRGQCPRCRGFNSEVIGLECPDDDEEEFGG